jgi:chorismate--pyruvate lyase
MGLVFRQKCFLWSGFAAVAFKNRFMLACLAATHPFTALVCAMHASTPWFSPHQKTIAHHQANRHLPKWLALGGSLTHALRRALGPISVKCLFQGKGWLRRDECLALGAHPRLKRAWVREVLLLGNQLPAVLARTVCVQPTPRGPWQALRKLGQRPLADVLFSDRAVLRSPLQVAFWGRKQYAQKFWATHWQQAWPAALAVHHSGQPCTVTAMPFWARRSVFLRKGVGLLVTEVFPAVTPAVSWKNAPVCPQTGGKPQHSGAVHRPIRR